MEREVTPDYAGVVDICTTASQKELVNLGLLAVLSPILVGLLLGEVVLGGFLAGIILSGQLLAVFSSNAGGAWDNAKKQIEDGLYGGKGSEAHKASITGDTVGDPLKDTSGPALNPMIKVINLVAMLLLPLLLTLNDDYKDTIITDPLRWIVWGVSLVIFLVLAYTYKNSQEGGFEFMAKDE